MAKRHYITRREAIGIVLSQDGTCPICGAKLQSGNLHFDHIVPLALGGADDESNWQAICAEPCHRKKTRGSKATEFGSDMHVIKKVRRLQEGRPKRSGLKIKSSGFDQRYSRKLNSEIVRNR